MKTPMTDEELETFSRMHQCLALSDGWCQKCAMSARIVEERTRADRLEIELVDLKAEKERVTQALADLHRLLVKHFPVKTPRA